MKIRPLVFQVAQNQVTEQNTKKKNQTKPNHPKNQTISLCSSEILSPKSESW